MLLLLLILFAVLRINKITVLLLIYVNLQAYKLHAFSIKSFRALLILPTGPNFLIFSL